jgi:quinolinate synthase
VVECAFARYRRAMAFPSLLLRADGVTAEGDFARAQARYLDPDPGEVARLAAALRATSTGIVAHFYMDAELQGVLNACAAQGGVSIHVSDSLLMADSAVRMAEQEGIRNVIVLGVDFMAENVRAMLDAAGRHDVATYRVAAEPIGCSLAAAAESRAYAAWLERAVATPRSLHVVYINTSLTSKAQAHARVPTITCTSSNVVRTVLQAFVQIPDAHVWFGPDSYMGANLAALFARLQELPEERLRAELPGHDRGSIARLRERFHPFEQGNCIVHHMFGTKVVEELRRDYADAYVTAHLEVPGEMFALGLAAQQAERGVVGSTADILRFIARVTSDALRERRTGRLRVVLGTESGMVSSIVRDVRAMLARHPDVDLGVEIVFPVASEAIATTDDPSLPVVPGVAVGEGCSTEGGCATCPYMKMNSLDATFEVLARLAADPDGTTLVPFRPRVSLDVIGGRSIVELGGEPILHMRHFTKTGELPARLVEQVLAHGQVRAG